MFIVRGKRLSEITAPEFAGLRAPYDATTIDVGAGDGAFAYRYARANPDRFVIALDPVRENMREYSARAARRPERGGVPNALYVVASIEQLPPELHAVADELFVTLPWGSLMRGIILAGDLVLARLASLARDGASVRIVLNTRIFDDPVPLDAQDLPEVTPDYVQNTLAPAFAKHSMKITDARWLDPDEVAAIGTTWAKRLSHRAPPRSVLIEATLGPRTAAKGHE